VILDGESTPVMLVDRQVDPVKGTLLHADFKRIDLTKRLRVSIPVHTTGEAAGVKVQGGLLEVITRMIEIECLPDEIPEGFTVDVTELMIGQAKRASDVALSGSMKLVSAPETVIAHSVAMRAEEVVEPTAAEAAAAAVTTGGRRNPGRARGHQEGQEGRGSARRGKGQEACRGKGQKEVGRHPGEARTNPERHGHMFLVAGLGNPGEEYALTPHNLGFLTVDRLAERHGIRVTRKDSKALAGVGDIDGQPVMLAKPQTYMNLSGASLGPLMEKHCIGPERLVVVYDELDLGWKALRIKPKGSAAGHKGMKSVISSLGTSEIVRVRLGIYPGHPVKDGAEFVLAPFKRSQIEELDEFTGYAADAVRAIIAEGVEMAMTKFNRRAPGLNREEE